MRFDPAPVLYRPVSMNWGPLGWSRMGWWPRDEQPRDEQPRDEPPRDEWPLGRWPLRRWPRCWAATVPASSQRHGLSRASRFFRGQADAYRLQAIAHCHLDGSLAQHCPAKAQVLEVRRAVMRTRGQHGGVDRHLASHRALR